MGGLFLLSTGRSFVGAFSLSAGEPAPSPFPPLSSPSSEVAILLLFSLRVVVVLVVVVEVGVRVVVFSERKVVEKQKRLLQVCQIT